MDDEAINKRKQKRHAKVIDDEDKGLNSFGIAKNVEKTMKEKQKRRKTRKQMQREEKEEELMARESRTKKRHDQACVSSTFKKNH